MTTRKEQVQVLVKHIEALKENTDSTLTLSKSLDRFGSVLGVMAKETGEWRKEDKENHANEAKQRDEVIAEVKKVQATLVNVFNKFQR